MLKLKTLGQELVAYGIGYMLMRMVSFVLLPLFTNVFSAEEYGYYSLIYAFLSIMQIFYNFGMDSTLMNYYLNSEKDNTKICTAIFIQAGIIAIGISSLLIVFSSSISILFIGIDRSLWMKIIAGILFFDTFILRMLIILRASGKYIKYLIITTLSIIINLVLSYIFVVKLGKGISGALFSTFIASFVVFLFSIPGLIQNINLRLISFKLSKEIFLFGIPFFTAAFFQIISEISDRFFLFYFTDIKTTGLYSAGYKLGSVTLFLVTAFTLGWQPYFLKNLKDKHAPKLFAKVATYLIAILSIFWLFMILFADALIQVKIGSFYVLGPEFWEASVVIPIVMLGYLFLGLYHLFMPGLYYGSQTKLIALYRGVGAICNIILNVLLIPKFGFIGAASATSISYLIMSILLYLKSNKLFFIPFNWKIISYAIIVPLAIYGYLIKYDLSLSQSIFILFGFVIVILYSISYKKT